LAKTIAANLLRSLGPQDRFEMLAFSWDTRALIEGPVAAIEGSIRRGVEELAKLGSGGGMEMVRAILRALQPFGRNPSARSPTATSASNSR
jgi:hypothetical protein